MWNRKIPLLHLPVLKVRFPFSIFLLLLCFGCPLVAGITVTPIAQKGQVLQVRDGIPYVLLDDCPRYALSMAPTRRSEMGKLVFELSVTNWTKHDVTVGLENVALETSKKHTKIYSLNDMYELVDSKKGWSEIGNSEAPTFEEIHRGITTLGQDRVEDVRETEGRREAEFEAKAKEIIARINSQTFRTKTIRQGEQNSGVIYVDYPSQYPEVMNFKVHVRSDVYLFAFKVSG